MIRVAKAGVCACLLLALVSCASTRLSQPRIMGLPWSGAISADGQATGLSSQESADPEFPDLYLFVDRTRFPELFADLWKKLPQFFASSNQSEAVGLEKIPSAWANQVMLFRPAGSQSLQIIVVGDFPLAIVQGTFSDEKSWSKRLLANGKSAIPIYESKDQNTHACLMGSHYLILQSDQVGIGQDKQDRLIFDQLINRSQMALLNPHNAKNPDKFQELLARENKDDQLFGYVSISLQESSPARAIRLRLTPVSVGGKNMIDIQATLLPRPEVSLKSLRTGIKLGLVSMAGIAGLESDFTNAIIFKEVHGNLQFSGLRIDSGGTIRLLNALLNPPKEPLKTQKDTQQ